MPSLPRESGTLVAVGRDALGRYPVTPGEVAGRARMPSSSSSGSALATSKGATAT